MHELLDQIEESLNFKLYFLSLYAALTIPDIAGALSSSNGRANGEKYREWYEKWGPKGTLSAKNVYAFRCSLLHQGTFHLNKQTRVIFVEPPAPSNIRDLTISIANSDVPDALPIDLDLFCRSLIQSARIWMIEAEKTENYRKNYQRFAHRHEDGIFPYIKGIPLIG